MPTQSTADVLLHFDRETLESASADYRRKKVRTITVGGDPAVVCGKVIGNGNKIVECEVHFHDESDFSKICCTDCECSRGEACRHTAALVLAFFDDPKLVQEAKNRMAAASSSNVVGVSLLDDLRSPELSLPRLAPRRNGGNIIKLPTRTARTDLSGTPIPPAMRQVSQAVAGDLRRLSLMLIESRAAKAFVSDRSLAYVLETQDTSNPLLSLKVFEVSRRKDGNLRIWHEISPSRFSDLPESAVDADHAIFRLWHGLVTWDFRIRSGSVDAEDDFKTCFEMAISRLLQSGRCQGDEVNGPLLKLGPRLTARFVWQDTAGGERELTLVPDGDKAGALRCLPWSCPWYFDEQTNECGPLDIAVSSKIWQALKSLRPIKQTDVIGASLLMAELGLPDIVPLPARDDEFEIKLVKPPCFLLVNSLEAVRQDQTREKKRALLLSFAPEEVTDKVITQPGGKKIILKQDRSVRNQLVEDLERLGFEDVTETVQDVGENNYFFFAENAQSWGNITTRAIGNLRQAGVSIDAQTENELLPRKVGENQFAFDIKEEGGWWFSLEIHIEVGGKKMPLLPVLREALARLSDFSEDSLDKLNTEGQFICLVEQQPIALPFDRIKTMVLALHELLLSEDKDKSLRLSSLHARQLLSDGNLKKARWLGADKMHKFVEQINLLGKAPQAETPKDFACVLRDYQKEGLAWLQIVSQGGLGGILADDMGLGKTVQVLAHILTDKQAGRLQHPVLVVCPTSVLPNWSAEIKRFCPSLRAVSFAGLGRMMLMEQFKQADIVLTTYGSLLRDIETLAAHDWHGIILDEAHAIKNPQAKVAECVKKISANYRFCLTGTPVENHLGELWSEFDFILPGMLGDKTRFAKLIRKPIEKGGDEQLRKALASRIRPFILRRSKAEVLKELPDKTVIIKRVELSNKQLDLYETIRLSCQNRLQAEIAKKGFNRVQIEILDALLKLRQVCCHPRLVNLPSAKGIEESAKLETLLEMIEQLALEGRKILLFSQFTSMLDLVAEELQSRAIKFVQLRGDTRDRVTPVEQFKTGADIPVFLLSLKAGGVGLNLTAADTVIHYDPWWNPAAEDQATDRAYRIGQDKNVFVYKLIANGTLEDRMLLLQERKRALAASIYDERGNLGTAFSEADLRALLQPIDALTV